MPDPKESAPLDKAPEEKIGQYIRRAREAAHMELPELAREIRIPQEILEHIELGRFDKLPVEAYVRGYLGSICNRLGLDRAKVLHWFAQERGKESSIEDLLSSDPGARQQSGQKQLNPWLWVILGIALVVLMVVLGRTQVGSDDNEGAVDSIAEDDSLAEDSAEVMMDSNTLDSTLADSSVADTSAGTKDSTTKRDSIAKEIETMLTFECRRDSTWVRITRTDGTVWSRIIRATSDPRTISDTDTLKVSVGHPARTRLFINGKRVPLARGTFSVYRGHILE